MQNGFFCEKPPHTKKKDILASKCPVITLIKRVGPHIVGATMGKCILTTSRMYGMPSHRNEIRGSSMCTMPHNIVRWLPRPEVHHRSSVQTLRPNSVPCDGSKKVSNSNKHMCPVSRSCIFFFFLVVIINMNKFVNLLGCRFCKF
jgi:hypothetical protein